GKDASTGMDDGVEGGPVSIDGTVSTADSRTGGVTPGFRGGMGSAQASSVLSGVSKDLWGPTIPARRHLNRHGTPFQGMNHSLSSLPGSHVKGNIPVY
ncbi:hypothetical protein, partial [Erwinia tasmaniensis]|uniref:hypothetical protein n=1 Tax=Erwinia tasmaniensis TaxID=338565 RepID=UPI003A4D8F8C